MAKTLGKLRTQTLKLKELEPPKDVSKGTKTFVRKHVYVVHPDANENGDDVFKAKNIKRSKRSPDHGYEPGEDEDIYEGAMKDFATKMDDMESMPNHPIWDESHPDHKSARRTLKNAPDSPQKRRIVKELGRDLKSGGEMQHHQSQYGITEGMPYFGSRSKLRDRIAAGKLGKSHAGPIRGGRTSEPHPNSPYDPNSKSKHERDMHAAYMYNFNREKKRSWRPGLNAEETEDLGEMRGLATLMAIRAAARAVRNNRPERSKPQKNKRGELLLTPDMQDPKQKAELAGLEAKIGRLAGYKSDMAAATRRKAARDYWGEKLDIEKTSMGGVIKDFQQSDAPQFKGKSKLERRKMAIAAKLNSEGFEHIAAMSESDQALLVDTYNSLTEENQERFLEIAETEEGCDKLLDFCITTRGND